MGIEGLQIRPGYNALLVDNYRADLGQLPTIVREGGLDIALAVRVIELIGGKVVIERISEGESQIIISFTMTGHSTNAAVKSKDVLVEDTPEVEQAEVHELLDDDLLEPKPIVEVSNPMQGDINPCWCPSQQWIKRR